MRSRRLSTFLILSAVELGLTMYPSPARSFPSSNSAQGQDKEDPNRAANPSTPSSQSNEPASNIKSAPTDEGQLATVNNAKIPSYSKVLRRPDSGWFRELHHCRLAKQESAADGRD